MRYPPAMRIGRYEIRGLLGRGGMGAVYKAAMPVTGRIVALKVLKPAEIMEDLVGEDALRDMFFKEAAAMSAISHVNVAAILDVDRGDDETPPYFTMEYYCGNLGVLMGETYEVETALPAAGRGTLPASGPRDAVRSGPAPLSRASSTAT